MARRECGKKYWVEFWKGATGVENFFKLTASLWNTGCEMWHACVKHRGHAIDILLSLSSYNLQVDTYSYFKFIIALRNFLKFLPVETWWNSPWSYRQLDNTQFFFSLSYFISYIKIPYVNVLGPFCGAKFSVVLW